MRFRKRIRIVKGLSINLSGSGASLTVGARGASVNIGKSGTYLNTGIPGTGIYNRQKLSGGKTQSHSSTKSYSSQQSNVNVKVQLKLDDSGNPILNVFNEYGNEIFDESTIRKVKNLAQYKESIERLRNEKVQEIEEQLRGFTEIYKFTPQLNNEKIVRKKLDVLIPDKYTREEFNSPKPLLEDIRNELDKESQVKIKKMLFWKNKQLRNKYIEDNLEDRFAEKTKKWDISKRAFIARQDKIEKEKNDRFNETFQSKKSDLENFLSADDTYISSKIESILSEISLPIQFSLDFEFDRANGVLHVDLDLPEIEDIPLKKVNVLSSGKISIKEKTQKEINHEYALCVCGISYYFCSLFFNITSQIKIIQISGYTQRINKQTGSIDDQYIYSIEFEREKFDSLKVQQIDPIEAFSNFKNRINLTSTFELKTIEPL